MPPCDSWWGKPGSLHIDCWTEVPHADGYEVSLRPEPFQGPEKLFYVNLGGYDGVAFTEHHRNVFVVTQDAPSAKARALKLAKGWKDAHRDDLYEAALSQRLYIHLTPALMTGDPAFTCRYTPLR